MPSLTYVSSVVYYISLFSHGLKFDRLVDLVRERRAAAAATAFDHAPEEN